MFEMFCEEIKRKCSRETHSSAYFVKCKFELESLLQEQKQMRLGRDEFAEINISRENSRSASSSPQRQPSHKKCRCKCGWCCCRNTAHRHHHRRRSANRSAERSQRSDYEIIGVPSQPPLLKQDEASSRGRSFWSDPNDTDEEALTIVAPSDSQHHRMFIPESFRREVVGPQTPSAVERMLAPTRFLLYYRRADSIASVDNVPVNEPLTMAYKSSDNRVSHYNVKCTYRDGNCFWRVDLGQGTERQHDFYSLSRLIRHYRAYMTLSGDIF